ncbi:MAG TPA: hypothetical protein VL463_11435 [Kofleriaceae bacterium]|nr:hypothetical protein [Kofleriaceae bacterium]
MRRAALLLIIAACGRSDAPVRPERSPSEARAESNPPACDVSIVAAKNGTWIALGSARRFIARCDRAIDVDATANELEAFRLAIRDDCPPTVDIGGAPGADFEDLLASSDSARAAGFSRIGMSGNAELAAAFPDEPTARDVAPAACPATPPPPRDPRIVGDDMPRPLDAKASAGNVTTQRMAVVSVDAETISFNGKPVAASTSSSLGLIPDLARALPPPAADLSIAIVGDRRVDATLIMRVVRTISMSGHKRLAFAFRK